MTQRDQTESSSRDAPIGVVMGVSFWKRARLRQFLGPIRFALTVRGAVDLARLRGGSIGVWASREPKGLASAARKAGLEVVRIEDGFLRSLGLGSDFVPPLSIVCDRRNIHYDPSVPSDLEILLATADFTPDLLERADRLRRSIISKGFTKYGAGRNGFALSAPKRARVILAPGQVEDDASITRGAVNVRTNLTLLKAVREANPDAYIIYRPHPDVDAGHRRGAVSDRIVLGLADQIARDAPMAAVLEAVDEVHTMTSLCGFEALIRGKRVVTYGQPFYAGWGLTIDRAPLERRTRVLSPLQLLAAALILYPRYIDPETGAACDVELAIERLSAPVENGMSPLIRLRRLQGKFRASFGLRRGTRWNTQ